MTTYMVLKDGIPPAFYREDVHGPLTIDGKPNPAYPAGGIEITDDQWKTFLTKQPFSKWDTTKNDFVDYTPPPPPPVVPLLITPRQFFQALALDGKITQDECLAYLRTGALPASLQALVNALPTAAQFGAMCLLTGADSFMRSSPLTEQLGKAYGMSMTDLDALWTLGASL